MRMLTRIFTIIIRILTHRSRFGRGRLLITYLRLRFTHAFLVKLFGAVRTRESVFGHQLFFYHYPTFVSLFEEIFVNEVYSFPGDHRWKTIVDCGANTGVAVLFFVVAHPTSTIVAFEPDHDAFEVLRRTCASFPNVTLVRKALCESEGIKQFYYDSQNPGMPMTSLKKERFPKGSDIRKVDCCRLSDYLSSEVDFVKMDIEGAEYEVLNEVSQSGRLRRIKEMAVEYHHHLVREEDSLSRLLDILERGGFGYQLSQCNSGSSLPPTYQDIHVYAYRK